jgi:flagellar hook-length control protein FliK
MDTAIAIPIPVQPIEAQHPAPGKDSLPAEAGDRNGDFAIALEQQIAHTPPAGAKPAHLKLPATDADDKAARTDTSDARDADDAATPDGFIAMMSAPIFAQTPQAAPQRAAAEPSGAITGAHAEGDALVRQRAGEREHAAPAQHARPLEIAAAADGQRATRGSEHEPAAAPLPSVLMSDAAMAASPAVMHAPTASAHAAAPIAAHEARIDARVGSADWGNGLAQQVTLMVKDGEHTAQLRLDPPDLGPLEVRLSMAPNEDGVAHAQFVSPHPAVRDALEAALPQLRAVLADNGITLGQASVGEGFVRDDARQPQQSSGESGRSARGNEPTGAIAAPRTIVRHGLVDTFA